MSSLLHQHENNQESEQHLKSNGEKFQGDCNELWRDIVGFEGLYQVSNIGNIRSFKRAAIRCKGKVVGVREYYKTLSGKSKNGYSSVQLCKKGQKMKSTHHHRIVATAFIPNPDNKPCVNHINGIKTDNRIENLEWVTYTENENHARKKLGKKTSLGQLSNLKNFDDDWGNPIVVGRFNIRSRLKKLVYLLLKKGVSGDELVMCGVKRSMLNSIIWSLEENGVFVSKDFIYKETGKSTRIKTYKINNNKRREDAA